MAQLEAPDISSTLPQVKHSLEPYIKTRQEVIHIRRMLAAFLSSQVTHSEDNEGHSQSLLLPCECTQDLYIPIELSGLRQAYLRALKEKRKAVRAYHVLSKETTLPIQNRIILDGKRRDSRDPTANLGAYQDLLRQRRNYEKLQILQDYLDTLSRKAPADAHYLDVGGIVRKLTSAPQPPADVISRTGLHGPNLGGRSIDVKLDQLKKSVLQSKHSLEYEESRLGRIKDNAEYISNGSSSDKSTQSRLNALTRVRTALIDWIEGELAKSGCSDEGAARGEKRNGSHRTGTDLLKHRQDIEEQYQEYVNARKTLLSTLSTATASITPPLDPAHSVLPPPRIAQHEPSPDYDVTAPLFLRYLEEHLLPLSNSQKYILQQRTQAITSLARRQRSNHQAIDRLKEESHLLSAYPLLSNNPRFRNATATLAMGFDRKILAFDDQLTSNHEHKLLDGARAWAFAAESSRSANKDFVDKKLSAGQKNVQEATGLLNELQMLVGAPDNQRQEQNGRQDDDAEIWASEALVKRRGKRDQQNRVCKPFYGEDNPVGPWSRLDGKVGGLGSGS